MSLARDRASLLAACLATFLTIGSSGLPALAQVRPTVVPTKTQSVHPPAGKRFVYHLAPLAHVPYAAAHGVTMTQALAKAPRAGNRSHPQSPIRSGSAQAATSARTH